MLGCHLDLQNDAVPVHLGTAQQCPLCQGSNGSNSISIWPLGDSFVGYVECRCPRKVGHDVTGVNL